MAVQLGDRVRDRITGFEGIVIGITDWLHGCRRPYVQSSTLSSEGKPIEAQSFDEPQLEILESAAFSSSKPEKTGGPRATPPNRPTPERR